MDAREVFRSLICRLIARLILEGMESRQIPAKQAVCHSMNYRQDKLQLCANLDKLVFSRLDGGIINKAIRFFICLKNSIARLKIIFVNR